MGDHQVSLAKFVIVFQDLPQIGQGRFAPFLQSRRELSCLQQQTALWFGPLIQGSGQQSLGEYFIFGIQPLLERLLAQFSYLCELLKCGGLELQIGCLVQVGLAVLGCRRLSGQHHGQRHYESFESASFCHLPILLFPAQPCRPPLVMIISSPLNIFLRPAPIHQTPHGSIRVLVAQGTRKPTFPHVVVAL